MSIINQSMMIRNLRPVLILTVLFLTSLNIKAAEVSQKAKSNFVKIDSLDVEKHWPSGIHVNWRTGVPDNVREKTPGKHTHCSAFAAAAAEILGVYLLRPPEHGQLLLANAQADWLASSDGKKRGWSALNNQVEAQEAANKGDLVIAVYKNRNPKHPGHIAVIRPSEKSAETIAISGPEIAQAGLKNYSDSTLSTGFAGHPHALAHHEIKFYQHSVR